MWGVMNAQAQPFKTWIIQDGMALMWQGRGIVAISVLLTVLISGLGSVMPGPALLDAEGATNLMGTIWQVIWFAIYAIPLIPVAYVSHIAVLRGEVGFAAMRVQGLAGLLRFARGMMAAALVVAVLGTLYQLVFVSDLLLMSAGRVDASAALRLGVGAVTALLVFALFLLLGAWGAMIVQAGQARFGDVLAVGRRCFFYLLVRLLAVVLFLPILSALVLPVMGQVVAILVAIGIPADPAFLIVSAAFSALIGCFAIVLISVTFCRAWQLAK
ncbi:hypothetical protein TH47_18085 [Thalassospira sp. MCCC 1A02803]|nr:hypothetical protein AUQ41_09615 [Thalassospira sp. MCCC 1A02898]ONH86113.1 hypothetical protein TH47_18085 [Thalassospira sp. MCCC 1A02803]